MKVEEILRDLVSFNTINDLQNIEIMNYIKKYLEEYSFDCELIGDEKKILIARTKKNPILGFVGHTDTVSYKETFGSNPFELIKKEGNLYGLGSCDMKGGIAAILKAISEINFNELNYGMMLIFTYDEEISFGGIKYFKSKNIKYPEYLIIGEPTNNIPMNSSKGVIEYNFDFYGKRSHSSMIEESSNINCINFLHELLELNKYFQRKGNIDSDFNYSTMNYGIIKGGERVNIVSDHTYATCDFRIINNEESDHVIKYVDEISKKYNMKYSIGIKIEPFINESEIVDYYEEITNSKRKRFFGISEASILEGNNIILGPGPITAHEDNEYISKYSLYNTVEIYKKIINKLLTK